MNKIIYDIDQMIAEAWDDYNSKRYFSALMISLMLPDICSKIKFNSRKSKHINYVNWCNKWLNIYFGGILPNLAFDYKDKFGEIIYQLRCSLLHNGENDISEFVPHFFRVTHFSLFIDEEKSFFDNSIISSNEKATGLLQHKNDFDIKINLGYLVFSIIQSVLLFKDKNKICDESFPTMEIEIFNNRKGD